MSDVSVVIPSRNGIAILSDYLPGILEETCRACGEVILVDDCSTDGTSDMVRRQFPSVRVLKRETDPGFCYSVNLGMKAAESEYLLLLNNDTVPGEGSFSALREELKRAPGDMAAAVPRIPRPDGTDDGNFSWLFRRGLAVTGEGIGGQRYPSGACALWRRSAWEELGGLDTRYAPIYWEDADMGARMHRAGFRMIRCPGIEVSHRHASTMGSGEGPSVLRERNRFIFMEANCSGPGMVLSRNLWLPVHLIKAGLRGNRAFLRGYREYRQWRELRA